MTTNAPGDTGHIVSPSVPQLSGPGMSATMREILARIEHLAAGRTLVTTDLEPHAAMPVGADLPLAEKFALMRHSIPEVASHFAMLVARALPTLGNSSEVSWELQKLIQEISLFPRAESVERAIALFEKTHTDELLPEFLRSLFDTLRRDGRRIDLGTLRTRRHGRQLGSGLSIDDMAGFLIYPDAQVKAHFADLIDRRLRASHGNTFPPEELARLYDILDRLRHQ
jgi:hypothetical protein